jgi:hypothetical protein
MNVDDPSSEGNRRAILQIQQAAKAVSAKGINGTRTAAPSPTVSNPPARPVVVPAAGGRP